MQTDPTHAASRRSPLLPASLTRDGGHLLSHLPTPDYQRGDCYLYQADCLDVMPRFPDGRVDAVVTDPQFFSPATHYSSRRDWGRAWSDLSAMTAWWGNVSKEAERAIGPAGHFLTFCDSESYAAFLPAVYGCFHGTEAVVWNKGRIGMGRPWRKQHELILAAWKADARLAETMPTVLDCPVVPHARRQHPAEKPVELVERLIRATGGAAAEKRDHQSVSALRGCLIVDPFMGSGTAAEACIRLSAKSMTDVYWPGQGAKRKPITPCRFIGIEKEPRYFDIACRRIDQAYEDQALFAEAEA